jgi:phage protein D
MTSAIEIYQDQEFYVPYFEVKLKNAALGQDVVRDIIQVSYKDSLENIDSFEITINNWDSEKRTFKYSDTDLFLPGNDIELWMGYYGKSKLILMLKGEITTLKPSFPSGGQPTLSISGLNPLHNLRKKQESHKYEKLKDSDIASQIAGRLGVSIRNDAAAKAKEETYEHIFQNNQYDIVFLMERARKIGYDLFVEDTPSGDQIYFGPTVNLRQTTYRLTYGRSLIQFTPNLDVSNQVSKVTVRGSDAAKKVKYDVTVTRSEIALQGLGCPAMQQALEKSFEDREEVITDKPVNSEQEARTLARETLERNAKQMVKGSGSTVGLPDLRAGSALEIDGLDSCFSGRYFVTATTHTIGGSGYTTQFECRREEV